MTMSPGFRKLALALHLTSSVGWVGAVAAYVALDVTAATGRNAQTLRAAYQGMGTIASNVIVPLAVASFATGIVMSLGTRWGLIRHYWVVVSLVLTLVATAVLLGETRTIDALAERAADPTLAPNELRALPNTLVHSVGGMVVLLTILVLNTTKPRGLTRYGWRRQQREQARAESGL